MHSDQFYLIDNEYPTFDELYDAEPDPVVARYFDDVGAYYAPLTKKAERDLVHEIQTTRVSMQRDMLACPEIIEAIHEQAKLLRSNPRGSGGIAKMGADFNNKKLGHNAWVSGRLENALTIGTAKAILAANFKHDVFDTIAIQHKPRWQDYRDLIRESEHRLFRTAIKVLRTVAKKYGSDIYGIDEKDCIQQANEAGLQAARYFRGDSRARFVTYAYGWAEKKVKGYIMYNSRLVHLPQRSLEKVFQVLRASNGLRDSVRAHIPSIAKASTLSEREVEEAILCLSGNATTLDQPINGTSSDQRPITLGESIADESIDIEEDIDHLMLSVEAENELIRMLDPVEEAVIYFRYLDPKLPSRRRAPLIERPYEEVAKSVKLAGASKRVLSRGQIQIVERRAFKKLRKKSIWFWERLEDDVLSSVLTAIENELFSKHIVESFLTGVSPTWSGTAKKLGVSPKETIVIYRSTMQKIRTTLPTLYRMIT